MRNLLYPFGRGTASYHQPWYAALGSPVSRRSAIATLTGGRPDCWVYCPDEAIHAARCIDLKIEPGDLEIAGLLPSASHAVRTMHACLRHYYSEALARDPDPRGSMRVVAEVARAQITARAEGRTGLNEEFERRVVGCVQSGKFADPDPGQRVRVTIPFIFDHN